MVRTLIVISLGLIFWSCEDRRTFDLDDFQKEVVLNSIISTDSSWNVQLSFSKSIFDESDFTIIEDATVRVHNLTNGQSFYLEKKKSGYYSRELHPVEGHEYAITAKVPGFEELKAMTYVPSVLEVDVVSKLTTNNEDRQSIEIDIEITDNPNEENYYVWELLEVDQARFAQNGSHSSPVSTIYEPTEPEDDASGSDPDPSENNENPGSNILSPDNIFSFNDEEESDYQKKDLNSLSFLSESDVRFGKIANRLILDSSIFNGNNPGNNPGSGQGEHNKTPLFELQVMAVSSDLYEFLKSYEIYKNDDIKNTSISDPVIIHSNIENGLGIFGGYNLKSFYIY